jgi:nucleoside-diphosphate-sugar epimerase|tara:strand:+ start:2197 stop:2919 length:723 start_codon:yes stop_codon:yes gene_type:complete
MRVLVTGHKGFIGRNVFLDWQETLGYVNVDGIDRPDDIADFKGGDYDLVIHLAAYADIRESLKNPQLYYENNVVKTKKLFDWCRETNTRLLYASSSAVEEDYWENPYAMTKWINEIMAPPNSVGMRFTTVYGPDSRPNMMYRMLEDKTATYVTNHKRDWIHVKDVCRAIHYLASSHITGPVTIGTGKSTSVKELAKSMGMEHLPTREDTPGERMDNQADVTLLKSIGWFPTIDVLDQTNS